MSDSEHRPAPVEEPPRPDERPFIPHRDYGDEDPEDRPGYISPVRG